MRFVSLTTSYEPKVKIRIVAGIQQRSPEEAATPPNRSVIYIHGDGIRGTGPMP
jgi:hypothetical protein